MLYLHLQPNLISLAFMKAKICVFTLDRRTSGQIDKQTEMDPSTRLGEYVNTIWATPTLLHTYIFAPFYDHFQWGIKNKMGSSYSSIAYFSKSCLAFGNCTVLQRVLTATHAGKDAASVGFG